MVSGTDGWRSPAATDRIELPVMGNPRSYRQWATGISTRTKYKAPISTEWTKRIDGVLLHRIWGPLIFLAVVFAVFQVVFSIGQPLSDGFGNIAERGRATRLARCWGTAGWSRC